MGSRTVLLGTVLLVALGVWAQNFPQPRNETKPVFLHALPNERSLAILFDTHPTALYIRVQLKDHKNNTSKDLCRIVYSEMRKSHMQAAFSEGPLPPKKPPRDFIVGVRDANTVGLSFLLYPSWLDCIGYVEQCGPSWDAAFLELDLNGELRERPANINPLRVDDFFSLEKSGWFYLLFYNSISLSISRLLVNKLPTDEVVKLLREDKLRLKSLKYEKDRWILQGELGDHGFEITLREFVELTQAEAVRIKEPWRVIRWGDRLEPDPQMPVPLIVKLNKVWRLR